MGYTNAFEALGFDREEATIQTLRADLAGILHDYIRQHGLTQAKASEKLGVSQGVVSEILRGRVKSKSVEYFVRLLARASLPWTARCWQPPCASVVLGAAPSSWTASGAMTTTANYLAPVPGDEGALVWNQTLQSGSVKTVGTPVGSGGGLW